MPESSVAEKKKKTPRKGICEKRPVQPKGVENARWECICGKESNNGTQEKGEKVEKRVYEFSSKKKLTGLEKDINEERRVGEKRPTKRSDPSKRKKGG